MSKEQGERIFGMIAAGVLLSNAAYNLSQKCPGAELSERDIKSLRECFKQWDDAYRLACNSGAVVAMNELPAVFDPISMGA
jgi:hypothetical protein